MTTRARVLVTAMRAFVLGFGTVALWLGREGINPDGVAYLDASDVFLAGEWPASGSGYWSPLYPTLLALARWLGGVEPERELLVAQSVNFGVFLLAFAALELFVRSMRRATSSWQHPGEAARPRPEAGTGGDARDAGGSAPNDVAWLILVYALFAVASVGWIRGWLLTPDMCVAAIVLAIAGLCVRFTVGDARWRTAVALGALLGLGYLAKAALLPMGIVVLATLIVLRHRNRRDVAKVAVAAMLFAGIAAPQVAYVSRLKGTLTYSDVGRLSYLWFIAGVPGPVSSAFPLPARLPASDRTGQTVAPLAAPRDPAPAVYPVDAPIPGTLPIWYDAGHWYRGVEAPFYPMRVGRALVRHVRVYLEVLGFILVGGVAAAVAARLSPRDIVAMRPAWVLVVPALAACAMYALVLVQTRYIAPFVLLLFAGLVPAWAADELSRRLRRGFAVGAVAMLPLVLHQVKVDTTFWRGSALVRASIVAELRARGVGPGSRLGYVGDAYDAHWARLGRLRFVTLLPRAEAPRFWQLDADGRAAVLDGMARTGAQVIIAEAPVAGVNTDGWDSLPAGPTLHLLLYRPAAVARR